MSGCSGCPSQSACSGGAEQATPQSQGPQKLPHARGSRVKYVLAVTSGKGGVGKSSVTAILAVQLARLGLKVGVMDADLMGPSIPQAFGVQDRLVGVSPEQQMIPVETMLGIKVISVNVLMEDVTTPVVWRGPIIAEVVRQFWQEVQWGDLDVLLVDTPPGTGDVALTLYQSLPVNGLLMVATPQDLVTMIVNKATRMAEMMNVPVLGLVENMSYFVCSNCAERHYLFGQGKTQKAAEQLGVPLLAELPIDQNVAHLVDIGCIEQLPDLTLYNMAERLAGLIADAEYVDLADLQVESAEQGASPCGGCPSAASASEEGGCGGCCGCGG